MEKEYVQSILYIPQLILQGMETKQIRRGGEGVDIRDPIIVIMMIERRGGSRMRRI